MATMGMRLEERLQVPMQKSNTTDPLHHQVTHRGILFWAAVKRVKGFNSVFIPTSILVYDDQHRQKL